MKKEEKKQPYILCPRCELNYIKAKDKYCTVCKAEMGLVDRSILLPEDEEVGLEKLCPICQRNYIGEDEEICFLCQKERDEREAAKKKDEWEELENENPEEDTPIGIIPLDEDTLLSDEEEPEEEEELVRTIGDDDFDYPDFDESELSDESELDEEEDEDDDDDDFGI